ncbi:CACTA en-spm transposon protein [Cucumis melo var. makuwa]|uniref:CACTA en-spm transposon protein n=1 Tax=Cucumis melo var. makuwa TaxID=1194695 RepID=A0A5D3BNB1_CUCMM|nr:CACTA en-spm transposon protein [Cucumis melo var. makuwa]
MPTVSTLGVGEVISGLMLGENILRLSRAIYRFVEHQMLMSFKMFKGDYHRHYKKYSDPEQACQPIAHIGRMYGRLTLPMRSLHES